MSETTGNSRFLQNYFALQALCALFSEGLRHRIAATRHTDDDAFKVELHECAHHPVHRNVELFGDGIDVYVASLLDDVHNLLLFFLSEGNRSSCWVGLLAIFDSHRRASTMSLAQVMSIA